MPKLNKKLLEEVRQLLNNEKVAFVPMPGGDPAAMDPAAMGGAPMDPAMAGGAPMDPAAVGGAPMDPAAMGGAPMDPAMAGGMPPMDPAAMGGMPPPTPTPAAPSGMISMTSEELLKFIKQIVAICTNGKFGNDPKPTDGGPVTDSNAQLNAKVDTVLSMLLGQNQIGA